MSENGHALYWKNKYYIYFGRTLSDDVWAALTNVSYQVAGRLLEYCLIEDNDSDNYQSEYLLMWLDHCKNYAVNRNAYTHWKLNLTDWKNVITRTTTNLAKSEEIRSFVDLDVRFLHPALKFQNKIMYMVIDGFPVYIKSTDLDDYSGKEKDKVYRYLLAVTFIGRIVFYFGPFRGASNDLNVLDDSELLDNLNDDEYVLGDGIYQAREKMIHTVHINDFMTEDEKIKWKMLAAYRSIVEQTIQKLKIFNIIGGRWRSKDAKLHGTIMGILCSIVNMNQILK